MVSQVQTSRIPMRRLALFTFLIWVRATATGDYHAWHLDFVRERRLLHRAEHVDDGDHRAALELRKTLRDFLANPPEHRPQAKQAARQLAAASRKFPLVLAVSDTGVVELAPGPGSNGLGSVLGQMIGLAQTDRLARLKTCASDECHWIFFDRSKPANRHWCSSSICGNRQKTRAYRERQRSPP